MKFSFLFVIFFGISAFAEPPEIVTAPKGAKKIHRDFYFSHVSKEAAPPIYKKEIFAFDENQRLISIETEYVNREGCCPNIMELFSYKLDERGRILEKTYLLNGVREKFWEYKYRGDGAFTVIFWRCELEGDLRSDPEETWQFNEKGLPISMEAFDRWGVRRLTYKYANWSQPGQRNPTHGNGKLLSIYQDSYKWDKKDDVTHYEDFRIYREDNSLEIRYDYDCRGAICHKEEYDERGDKVKGTIFSNEIVDGKYLYRTPIGRSEIERAYSKLHGIELLSQESEIAYNINYPRKSEEDWSLDFSQDGTESFSIIRKYVYRYEFHEDFLKKEAEKEKEEKAGK
ncbi:MAG: hypothetical protein Q7S83_02075 [bacterium]|nr:hypothetical protein [bacterium]